MKTQMVGARVPLEWVKKINQLVEKGYYLTPSELIKVAIQKELERLEK
jgi:Arc/MetJ-type ribon-helix-helix transcriptional regulator